MPTKILSVDDSKAVRIIVKKSFKKYAVEIVEASNGVEGLAAAAAHTPDIILLDVTMPVMDGVEMLTKLKADPALKGIPVIMLTAEAGRENVMRIAKIGIRDYIIKPFKEDALADKVSRIVELKLKDEAGAAGGSGAPAVDPAAAYFNATDESLTIKYPAEANAEVLAAISKAMGSKIADAVDNGLYEVIFDVSALADINEEIVNNVQAGVQNCQELTLNYSVSASDTVAEKCKTLDVAKEWEVSIAAPVS